MKALKAIEKIRPSETAYNSNSNDSQKVHHKKLALMCRNPDFNARPILLIFLG